ncbi:Similar to Quinate dehydrogenase; acc. no. P11635 [Pyronema omphalodes CBS 100304]|uniref:Similar to Quinate dehydrogenase acc. no. P11635 n=1 Tax=Pyronema omphalodes (strain CBS 100304) TaxID=1076935 RepID=U4L9A5_PYROM|nr:Similar to Quinate dehydrogenase; acc. no. P11635 [Pyronema omphalodes CBS 100304]
MSLEKKYYYLAGQGIKHSIAPTVHQTVASSLGLPWEFLLLDVPTVTDVIATFQRPDFAGGVVTMPYKQAIMAHLDKLDHFATTLNACNNVYLSPTGELVGSNTDWIGILECLRTASSEGKGKPALVIGAGGASRAAVYALHEHLQCEPIYVINRLASEVEALKADAEKYSSTGTAPTLVHIENLEATRKIPESDRPFYVVGTVPDLEPKTEMEVEAASMLRYFFKGEKGVFLDMCFNPRNTRSLKAAKEQGWMTVEGINIVGWQIGQQYENWAGKEKAASIPHEKAWEALRVAADNNPFINK